MSAVIEMCLEDMGELGHLPEFIGIQKVILDDTPSRAQYHKKATCPAGHDNGDLFPALHG